ncbi:MAG: hypothetical protein BAJATHORv1_10390 [Candidatus Thorarchaeota archaeon]|nr:MAG: hypothetical protein BAJATHORv1_10390 [Candidatus Thorarchaeota archaeon]
MGKLYVLDTGALLSTWTQTMPENRFLSTQSVIDELENRPSRNRAETLISLDRLQLITPESRFIAEVRNKSEQMGDSTVLSETDIELLAIALAKHRKNFDVVLVSTDFAVLNTSTSLGISILDPKMRMRERIKWVYRCKACGRVEERAPKNLECPVCGTMMDRKSKRRFRVQK